VGEDVRLQWNGTGVYRGADAARNASLTCEPGDVVTVSAEKAAELLADPSWKPYKPKSSAAKPSGVPGGEGGPASNVGTAMHTGADDQKSDRPRASAGKKGSA
jgi:hypothetical protein